MNSYLITSTRKSSGKTTITKKIQQKYQSFKISVSHTTRKPRANEVDGVDYHFVSDEKFKSFAIIQENNCLGISKMIISDGIDFEIINDENEF